MQPAGPGGRTGDEERLAREDEAGRRGAPGTRRGDTPQHGVWRLGFAGFGRDHSRPLRCSAWRRYHVRRDISSLSQGFLASMVLARSSIRGRPVLRCLGMSLVADAVDGVAPARAGGEMSRLILRAAPWERRQASVRTSARVHEFVPSHRPNEPVGKDAASMAVTVDHLIRSATTRLRRLVETDGPGAVTLDPPAIARGAAMRRGQMSLLSWLPWARFSSGRRRGNRARSLAPYG